MKTIRPYGIFFYHFRQHCIPISTEFWIEDDAIEEIVVLGELVDGLGLRQSAEAASRIGLSLLETPSSVAIISGSTMQARGYKQVTDAVKSLPGVVTGEYQQRLRLFYSRFTGLK